MYCLSSPSIVVATLAHKQGFFQKSTFSTIVECRSSLCCACMTNVAFVWQQNLMVAHYMSEKNCPGLIGKTALVTFPMSYVSKTNKQETKHKHESLVKHFKGGIGFGD